MDSIEKLVHGSKTTGGGDLQLKSSNIERLLLAIEQHFDPFSIDRLLETRFGLKLHNVTSVMKNFTQQVVDVHRFFDQRNQTEELVAALRDARPEVYDFIQILDAGGFVEIPARNELEVLVRKGGGTYKDVVAFRTEIAKIEAAVCRITDAKVFWNWFSGRRPLCSDQFSRCGRLYRRG